MEQPSQPADRVAIVTGGGTGIGRATVLALAQAGVHVLAVGRRPAPLAEVERAHARIVGLPADISSQADVERIVEEALARWDRVDIVVNNAGAFAMRPLADVDAALVRHLFDTNVLAPTLLVQQALAPLKRSQGVILNISSTFGHKPSAMIAHYAASKAALEMLTRSWALELAPHKVRVNAVAPGPTETPILARSGFKPEEVAEVKRQEAERIPLSRRGEADEVARWIVALSRPEAAWVTGQVLGVDGGLSAT